MGLTRMNKIKIEIVILTLGKCLLHTNVSAIITGG